MPDSHNASRQNHTDAPPFNNRWEYYDIHKWQKHVPQLAFLYTRIHPNVEYKHNYFPIEKLTFLQILAILANFSKFIRFADQKSYFLLKKTHFFSIFRTFANRSADLTQSLKIRFSICKSHKKTVFDLQILPNCTKNTDFDKRKLISICRSNEFAKKISGVAHNRSGFFFPYLKLSNLDTLSYPIKVDLELIFNDIYDFETKNSGINPLMGWESSSDTLSELNLEFSTKELAIEYAKKNKIDFEIIEPQKRKIIKKSYADNFLK